MPGDQFLNAGLEPAAVDFANLQAIAAQNAANAELDVEQLALQQLASNQHGSGVLGR